MKKLNLPIHSWHVAGLLIAMLIGCVVLGLAVGQAGLGAIGMLMLFPASGYFGWTLHLRSTVRRNALRRQIEQEIRASSQTTVRRAKMREAS